MLQIHPLLVQQLVSYLKDRPYHEVNAHMDGLMRLQPVPKPASPEPSSEGTRS